MYICIYFITFDINLTYIWCIFAIYLIYIWYIFDVYLWSIFSWTQMNVRGELINWALPRYCDPDCIAIIQGNGLWKRKNSFIFGKKKKKIGENSTNILFQSDFWFHKREFLIGSYSLMYFGPHCIASIQGKGLWMRNGFLDTCFVKRRSWVPWVNGPWT